MLDPMFTTFTLKGRTIDADPLGLAELFTFFPRNVEGDIVDGKLVLRGQDIFTDEYTTITVEKHNLALLGGDALFFFNRPGIDLL